MSILVMFHLEMSSSDAIRETELSTWTALSGTPDRNAWEQENIIVKYVCV